MLAFDVAGVGASNSILAIVDRLPILQSFSFTQVGVICSNVTAGTTWNIVLGDGAIVGTSYDGIAVAGTPAFAVNQAMPTTGGEVAFYTIDYPGCVWPTGYTYSDLTLRIVTPVGGGTGGVKVTLQ